MTTEIERKFLVDKALWDNVKPTKFIEISQGYVSGVDGNVTRVRVANEIAFLTIKGMSRNISRLEFEYKIPLIDANVLLKELCGSLIEKRRYLYQFGAHTWEVDEFLGDNRGLIVAEIELKSEVETFSKPEFIVKEVSDDSRYYNSNIQSNPFCNWD